MEARAVFPAEIQEQIRKGYIIRLDQRVKRMRKFFAERNWVDLRQECMHLRKTAPGFGLADLASLAERVELSLEAAGGLSRAQVRPEAKLAAENLFSEIYKTLSQESLI
ncbi:MAG: hypothetical protein AB7P04_03360 [Bacteriovoracia bacterium]